ncbi:katanin p80 WD40 repeat-containing subunit B1 homolog KTN80.4-like isoform X1 [Typha latifolia]|uniref:katanin p80 WD40 repeat-containing subunit B1 homolog KTN80.4-like isoform X1 n=1 Tax=Typha latifolia TaxID=4733 RepID=UPI003C2D0051
MEKRGYKLQEFVAHASDVNCLSIGKKSNRVFITGGEDRKVNMWAIGKPTPLLSLSGHTSSVDSVAFDSAEVLVLAGSSNGTIKLWDLEEAKVVRTLTGHRSNCSSVEFHPFGEFFASGSFDADLKIWDIRKKGCIHTYKGHTRGIRTINFTPDGRWVVTGGEDNVVKIWDLTAGKLLHDFKFHNGQIQCIGFHPHEFLLATGSADRTVKFWDLETFELIGSAGPEATGVRSMVFHPDGRTLFCGLDMTLKVFSWEPVICHDVVNIGWSTLADLTIYEGNLLGCSFHESRVGVWLADISLIGPYALSVLPKTNSLTEPKYSLGDYSVKLPDDNAKSSSVPITSNQDLQSKTESTTTDQYYQRNLKGIRPMYAPDLAPLSSSGVKGQKNSVTCNGVPRRFDSKSSFRSSTVNSSAVRVVKSTANSPNTVNRAELNPVSRVILIKSSTVGVNSSSTLKKGPMTESHFTRNTQATSDPVSMPVIVLRDSGDHEKTGGARKGLVTSKAAMCDDVRSNSIHFMKQSCDGNADYGESKLTATLSEPLSSMSNNSSVLDSNLCSRHIKSHETLEADERNQTSIRNIEEKFESSVSLEQSLQSHNDKSAELPCSSTGTSGVRYVRGVAVQLGRTRSLVESWERRERCNSSNAATISSTSDHASTADGPAHLLDQGGPGQTKEKDLTSVGEDIFPEMLIQNHDVFINAVKSRLTKLQVVRHFFEQNGIKGAVNAVAKLPDHYVQADVICILKENIELLNLENFSRLLPVLAGLVNSKMERHIAISLEMLLELTKIFGPVIHSTVSATSIVGVDLQAEQRWEHCNCCFNHLQNIKKTVLPLIRRGGTLAKLAEEMNITLQESVMI